MWGVAEEIDPPQKQGVDLLLASRIRDRLQDAVVMEVTQAMVITRWKPALVVALALALSAIGLARELSDVPEGIRAQLIEMADTLSDGRFLIVGRFQFSDNRAVEGGTCPDAFVTYVQETDESLAVEADGWFYTRDAIESAHAEGGVLRIRASGHRPIDMPLNVNAAILLLDDIILMPETDYSVQGTVLDAAGDPVPNIQVSLHFPTAANCWEPIAVTHANDVGQYSFEGLSSAEHRVVLGVPFGYLYVTADVQPQSASRSALADFTLYSQLRAVIDYVYQRDGSRTFMGSGAIAGSATWETTYGFDFDDGAPEYYEADDLRDLELEQDGGNLTLRVVYLSDQENGFYQVTDTDFDAIIEAAESGYGIRRVSVEVGDVFVVRTYEGHYAKLVVRAIEEMPH